MSSPLISREDFAAYVAVQKSGVTNMFAVDQVCELSGLSRDQVLAIMEGYAGFEAEFSESSCPSSDRSRLSPDCSPTPGGYCSACGAGSDHS